jgi:hypothetical protein
MLSSWGLPSSGTGERKKKHEEDRRKKSPDNLAQSPKFRAHERYRFDQQHAGTTAWSSF